MKHPPLTAEQQATVVKWLPAARKFARRIMARRRSLRHIDDEAYSIGYEAACRAVLTWKPHLGAYSTCLIHWIRHFAHMAECHYSRVVHLPRKYDGPSVARAYSLEAEFHKGDAMHGHDVTWKDMLRGNDVIASAEATSALKVLAEHIHEVLSRRGGDRQARIAVEWWRRRAVYGDEFGVIAKAHGVSRQAVEQRVARVQRVVDAWSVRVRREQEAA